MIKLEIIMVKYNIIVMTVIQFDQQQINKLINA